MFATFEARATEASAEVFRVRTRAEALDLVVDRLEAEGVGDGPSRSAVWADCPFLDELERDGIDRDALRARVPGLHFDVTVERAERSLIGISQLDWAIADTGSIAQDAGRVAQRLVSTLPPTHLALLPGDAIVPDLAALLQVLRPEQVSYLALITGPSRTADIERVLTIGVHGPKRLVIVFVDELARTR